MTEKNNDGEEQRPRRRRWFAHNTSVATRLVISALVVSITSLLITGFVLTETAGNSADEVIRSRLSEIAAAKATEIEGHFEVLQNEVADLAASRMVIDGVQEFSGAYDELGTLTAADIVEERGRLSAFYLDQFVPALDETRSEPVATEEMAPGRNWAAWYLQDKYIAGSPFDVGERDLLNDAQDGSRWTEVHRELHPIMREVVNRFGMADLYLIEPESGTIVYSTGKNPDFATSLDAGPHSDTALAGLVGEVLQTAEEGRTHLVDFSHYPAQLDQPSLFIGAPIFESGELVGVLAAGLPEDDINTVMTREWGEGRFGDTGEVYLVAADGTMRSVARAFVEDAPAYLRRIAAVGTASSEAVTRMDELGTTVLSQEIDNEAVEAALSIDAGLIEETNYLGDEVFTAYRPVDVDRAQGAANWVILAEQTRAEVNGPAMDLRLDSVIVAAVFVVALTFLMATWANSFVGPLRRISAALNQAEHGDLDTEVPAAGAREFRELARSFNLMVDDLAARRGSVSRALGAKVEMLRTLLPPVAARRIDAGDRSLLETVPQATVVVLVVQGIAELVRERTAESNRALLHSLIDELDEIAETNGLERVKVMGDTYYAACGLSTPYLDHAPRSVSYALQARELLLRMSEDDAVDLDISVGCHTGSVTVGLTGGSRLVYDLWGDTVTRAHRLARAAGIGQILVSEETRQRLPSDEATERVVPADGATAWAVLGSRSEVDAWTD